MNKDCEQHLQELIDYYSKVEITDIEYIRKLFVRNLKDVQRRYVKYDKPRKERIDKAIKFIKEHNIIGVNIKYLPNKLEKCYSYELINILKGEE